MKRLSIFLIFACCAMAAFAQNVKPYKVDLNRMPAVNGDKTATFDKATKTVTFNSKKDWKSLSLFLSNMDITTYNIARVKYRALGDYGFIFELNYTNNNGNWNEMQTYCPSYLTEMVIPLLPKYDKLNQIAFAASWRVPYEQIVIESVTFERVENPVKTDIYATNDLSVIDTANSGKIDDKISAWDYVKELGVGFQYYPFVAHDLDILPIDCGTETYSLWNLRKPSKEMIHFIKEKGFKTLRLQTAPEFHLLDENYTIDPRYLIEIKNVVDWAIEEDMYVVICGPFSEWLQKEETFKKKVEEEARYAGVTVTEKYKKQSKALIKAVWSQYAAAFNNSYDEHLIFETLNEPIDAFHEHDWFPQTNCAVCKKDYAILNEYNQLIVDTIRASGGNNTKRFIMVEGLGASRWQYISNSLFKLPKDKTKDRLIPTVHLYPMAGRTFYTSGIKQQIRDCFAALDKVYFSKHIPVYFSEIGFDTGIPILEKINCLKDFMAEVTDDKRSCAVLMHMSPQGIDPLFTCYNEWTLEWYDTEYIDMVLYSAQKMELPLSDDFIKKNEVKIESIVGKNILQESFNPNNWTKMYIIKPDILVRSVPSRYKLEFQVEKTGPKPILQVCFDDRDLKYNDVSTRNDVKVSGAVKGNNFEVKSTTVTITVNEKLAYEFENADKICLNGQDIIIKSMKVME